jgi:hypothetical protein
MRQIYGENLWYAKASGFSSSGEHSNREIGVWAGSRNFLIVNVRSRPFRYGCGNGWVKVKNGAQSHSGKLRRSCSL